MFSLRPFEKADWDRLRSLHEKRGLDFKIPSRLSEAVVVVDDETGEVVQILGTVEIRESIVWMNPDWASPRWRWEAFVAAHEDLREQVEKKGVEDVFIQIHPSIPRGFGKRLMSVLGWTKPEGIFKLKLGR